MAGILRARGVARAGPVAEELRAAGWTADRLERAVAREADAWKRARGEEIDPGLLVARLRGLDPKDHRWLDHRQAIVRSWKRLSGGKDG